MIQWFTCNLFWFSHDFFCQNLPRLQNFLSSIPLLFHVLVYIFSFVFYFALAPILQTGLNRMLCWILRYLCLWKYSIICRKKLIEVLFNVNWKVYLCAARIFFIELDFFNWNCNSKSVGSSSLEIYLSGISTLSGIID